MTDQASAASASDAGRARGRQPARESNIDAIVAYFESGITQDSGRLGIELEHTLVHDDLRRFPTASRSASHGSCGSCSRATPKPPATWKATCSAWRARERPSRSNPPPSWSFRPAPFPGWPTRGNASTRSSARSKRCSSPRALGCSPWVPPERPRRRHGTHPQAALSVHGSVLPREGRFRHLHDARQRLHAGVDRLLVGARLPAPSSGLPSALRPSFLSYATTLPSSRARRAPTSWCAPRYGSAATPTAAGVVPE